jgi:hypothetical protein
MGEYLVLKSGFLNNVSFGSLRTVKITHASSCKDLVLS